MTGRFERQDLSTFDVVTGAKNHRQSSLQNAKRVANQKCSDQPQRKLTLRTPRSEHARKGTLAHWPPSEVPRRTADGSTDCSTASTHRRIDASTRRLVGALAMARWHVGALEGYVTNDERRVISRFALAGNGLHPTATPVSVHRSTDIPGADRSTPAVRFRSQAPTLLRRGRARRRR